MSYMKERMGDNVVPFPKFEAEKAKMIQRLKDVVLVLREIGHFDTALRFEEFQEEIKKSEKISDDDKARFQNGMTLAEDLLRELAPEKANGIFGISNVT